MAAPFALRKRLWNRQGSLCYWCAVVCEYPNNRVLKRQPIAIHFTIEHVIPKEYGGTNSDTVGACYRCNNTRNTLLRKLQAGKSIRHILVTEPELKEKLLHSILPYLDEQKILEIDAQTT